MNRICLLAAVLALSACGSSGGGGGSSGSNATVTAALSAVAAAPTGWKSACSSGSITIISAVGDQFTLEQQTQGGGVCNGTDDSPRNRTTLTASSATTSGSSITLVSPTVTKIQYMAPNSSVVNDINARSSGGVTGMCGKTNWVIGTWVDAANTVCYNFSSAPNSGPGVSSPIAPNVYSHVISNLTFTVSGSTLTDSNGTTYTKY